ncbi:hypothetical protein EYF80_019800 [Liparis tanakae]|uniref:Uncharacterized protein n=1 Tax=Liparis tanakae TaxID=230148 RepID=A0A4Z2HW55_9TELE|nr:hypothetical protein EYF80_019800 [Liparis tanakae]
MEKNKNHDRNKVPLGADCHVFTTHRPTERRRGLRSAPSYLVMSSRVTSLPALTAALKLSAPAVSMATMGTSVQPASFRPWATPQRSPPPPTESSTAPGLAPEPREAATSAIILAWPCLREREREGERGSSLQETGRRGSLCRVCVPEQRVIERRDVEQTTPLDWLVSCDEMGKKGQRRPIPRILKEPEGCVFSIFRYTGVPTRLDMLVLSSSGVFRWKCFGMVL